MKVAGVISLVGMVCSGCGASPDISSLDAQASGDGNDASVTGKGLQIELVSAPDLPATINNTKVESIRLSLVDVRIIGDSASGDEQTRLDDFTITWPMSPAILHFPNAPIGVYSTFRARLASFEFLGQVHFEGDVDFEISNDNRNINVELALGDVELEPGQSAESTLMVRFAKPFEKIEWELEGEEGDEEEEETLHLEDEKLAAFEQSLEEALDSGSRSHDD